MDAQPDRVANIDQACASMSDAARMHSAYFKRLIADGLERAEALELTIGYMNALMDANREDEDE